MAEAAETIKTFFMKATKRKIINASRDTDNNLICFYCRAKCNKDQLTADRILPQKPASIDDKTYALEQR